MFKYWCSYILLAKVDQIKYEAKTYFQNEKLNHNQHHRM